MPTSAPVECPGCKRRKTLKEHSGAIDAWDRYEVATWQCVYCGTVCERGFRGIIVHGVERIILAPGELEQLRNQRAGRPVST